MTDSTLTTNPSGGAEVRRGDTEPALHVELMERILAADNLRRAWRQVKANRGAPVDGVKQHGRVNDIHPGRLDGDECRCLGGHRGGSFW